MIAVAWFQAFLDGTGSIVSALYDLIPNYGLAIIVLTLLIRVLLLPLGIKQVRSQQAMAAVAPKVKEIQRKYKGNRQKMSEATMALYREHKVNPLSGCLPLLAQFPVLIALFAVLQYPQGLTHIPTDSKLYSAISSGDTHFVGTNLVCSAAEAGNPRVVVKIGDKESLPPKDCGDGIPVRAPYYLLGLAMVGTTFFQQRQMLKASPPGSNPQMQALTKIMPIMFGVWGFIFPAGLVLYWTTTNAVQIGQQHFLLSRGPAVGVDADRSGDGSKPKKGAAAKGSSKEQSGGGSRKAGSVQRQSGRASRTPRPSGGAAARAAAKRAAAARSGDGASSGGSGGSTKGSQGSGGSRGDRKKRRKR